MKDTLSSYEPGMAEEGGEKQCAGIIRSKKSRPAADIFISSEKRGEVSIAVASAEQSLHALRSQDSWQKLRRQIIERAIRFADNAIFDFRLLLTDARCAEQAGQMLWQLIRPFAPQVLVGPGLGAAPLLYAVALAALRDDVHLHVLMVRDKRKEHNQKKWVEGRRQPDHSRAIVLDDFMESGSALPLVERALKADGHQLDIQAVALFFDMWQPLGSRQISTGRYPVVSLYTRHDIGLSRDCFDARPPSMKGRYPDFVAHEPLWWRLGLNDKTDYPLKCAPVIADNAVFVADDHSRVWRHDARSGDIAWCYESLAQPRKGIVQQLQYADGSLVFGCYDGTVTRLDAASGALLWRWRVDSSVHATPALDLEHGRLFINTEQWNEGQPFGHLTALDWRTGKTLWQYTHPWWPPGSPIHDARSNVVMATCNDQTLLALDADSGQLRWERATRGLVRGKPAIAHGRVLVATEKGHLACLSIDNGEALWRSRYGRGEMHQFLQIAPGREGDVVITLDARWHLVAFDIASGAIRWMSRLRSAGNWCPVTCGDYLVVLSRDGHLAVFDPLTENKVWEGSTSGHYRQPPAIGRMQHDDGSTTSIIALASNNAGLKVFAIDPFFTSPRPS